MCDAILRESFGPVVADVAKGLHLGRKTLIQLIQAMPAIPRDLVKESLIVLLQHHIVVAIETENGPVFYNLVVAEVLWRLHIPKYLNHVWRQHGTVVGTLLEVLLLHGRIRASHFRRILASRGAEFTDAAIHQAFNTLIEHRFAKKVIVYLEDSDVQTGGQFDIPSSVKTVLTSYAGAKHVRDSDDSTDGDEGVYWQVNAPALNNALRHRWVVDIISQRFDAFCARIVDAILSLKARDPLSAVRQAEIHKYMIRNATDQGDFMEMRLMESLRVMDEYGLGIIVSQTGVGGHAEYKIDFDAAVQHGQQLAIETIVKDKFGEPSHRLFHLLLMKKFLEQKQISSMALVASFKETKALLNKMLKANYLSVQEIPKHVERTPQRCVYLWRVDVDFILRNNIDCLYKTIANMRSRFEHEKSIHSADLKKRSHPSVQMKQESGTKVETAEDRLGRLHRSLSRLEHGELQMLDQLNVLQGFQI